MNANWWLEKLLDVTHVEDIKLEMNEIKYKKHNQIMKIITHILENLNNYKNFKKPNAHTYNIPTV